MDRRRRLSLAALAALVALSYGLAALAQARQRPSIDTRRVERVAARRAHDAAKLLQAAAAEATQGDDSAAQARLDALCDAAERGQTYLLVYRNWTLKRWPGAHMPAPATYTPAFFERPVVRLGDAYYLRAEARHLGLNLVALSLIKEQPARPTAAVADRFADAYGLPGSIRLTTDPAAGAAIRDGNGEHLFSLVALPSGPQQSPAWALSLALFAGAIALLAIRIGKPGGLPQGREPWGRLAGVVAAIVALRLLMLHLRWPAFLYSSPFFDPAAPQAGWPTPSAGDLVLNCATVLALALRLRRAEEHLTTERIRDPRIGLALSGLLLSAKAVAATLIIDTITRHSGLPFGIYSPADIDIERVLYAVAFLTGTAIYAAPLYSATKAHLKRGTIRSLALAQLPAHLATLAPPLAALGIAYPYLPFAALCWATTVATVVTRRFKAPCVALTTGLTAILFVTVTEEGRQAALSEARTAAARQALTAAADTPPAAAPAATASGSPLLERLERPAAKRGQAKISTALYTGGKLAARQGAFAYPTRLPPELTAADDGSRGESDARWRGHRHQAIADGLGRTAVASTAIPPLLDEMAFTAYIFVLGALLTTLAVRLRLRHLRRGPSRRRKRRKPSFRAQVQISTTGVMLLSIAALGVFAARYTALSTRETHRGHAREKRESITAEIAAHLAHTDDLPAMDTAQLRRHVERTAALFRADVNLYDRGGELAATSCPALYSRRHASPRMSHRAWRQLQADHGAPSSGDERIGQLTFRVSYAAVANRKGEVVAYIGLPVAYPEQGAGLLAAPATGTVVNLSVLLMLLTLTVSYAVGRRVTAPLLLVRDQLRKFDPAGQNAPVEYAADDEIGALVAEYNRMTRALVSSREALAQNERKVAWQDMARQVAHEIKNPLTPMRLNIQLLERAWDDKARDFDSRLRKVCRVMVEQIDTLSNIAGEFSLFAQMPKERPRRVDLNATAASVAALFAHTQNARVSVEPDPSGQAAVMADPDQLARVFTNLVKNAIQAIPEDRIGQITITISSDAKKARATITDDGEGIPADRRGMIFQPNFTTKSSGMGLGLAMIKNIIQNMRGEIWFETVEHEGSTFHLSLPKAGAAEQA